MGHAIPSQHPAVVLRSRYQQLRALLATAMIAVIGLSTAVVILATDDDPATNASSATQASAPSPTGSTRYDGGPEEGTRGAIPAQPRITQQQAFPGLASQALESAQAPAQGSRYDGGPEEGTRGIVSTHPRLGHDQAFPGLARQATGAQPAPRRYDGGPEEGTRGRGH
jgi:hypothetical protein